MKRIYAVMALYAEEMEKLEAKQAEFLLDKASYSFSIDEDEEDDRPYQVLNGIALYNISGKMLSSGNFFTRMFGIPTYDSIAGDFARMASDGEVKKVLISMSTPGGNVGGLSDASDAWRRLNEIKPITVHTASTLASAGLWLASNSTKIYASETADVGSIGVVLQHVSHQERLKKEGVKVTTIKSSPLKYVGDPTKDLTAEEEAHLQKKVTESDELFKAQMYRTRPLLSAEAFTGETFSAANSLRIGLIDGVETFSSVFEQLSASADSNNNKHSYTEGLGMKRKVTAAMAEAAVASGANPEDFEIVSQEEYDAHVAETAELGAHSDTDVDAEDENLDVGATDAEEGEVELTAEAQQQIDVLTAELTEAQATIETLTAQVTDLTGQVEQLASDPLRVIAEERIQTYRIGLGLMSIDMSDFSTKSLVAEHNVLKAKFEKAYKSGGHVTAKVPGNNENNGETKAKVIPMSGREKAALKSVGIN